MTVDIETVEAFDEYLMKYPTQLLIQFHAEWCGWCVVQTAILMQLQLDCPDQIVLRVDIDYVSELGQRFDIRKLPTMLLIKDGVPDIRVGTVSREDLREWLSN